MSATVPLPVSKSTNDANPYHTSHALAIEVGRDPERDQNGRSPLLDQPSDRHPILDALFDHALLRIILTADGATTNYHPTEYLTPRADRSTPMGRALAGATGVRRVHSGGTMAPQSSLAEDLARLEAAYTSAKTHRFRLRVIKEAQEICWRIQIAPKADPALIKGTREYREKVAHDTRPCRTVARSYRISLRDVVAWRKEFKVSALPRLRAV